jgi:hypothetical protein
MDTPIIRNQSSSGLPVLDRQRPRPSPLPLFNKTARLNMHLIKRNSHRYEHQPRPDPPAGDRRPPRQSLWHGFSDILCASARIVRNLPTLHGMMAATARPAMARIRVNFIVGKEPLGVYIKVDRFSKDWSGVSSWVTGSLRRSMFYMSLLLLRPHLSPTKSSGYASTLNLGVCETVFPEILSS